MSTMDLLGLKCMLNVCDGCKDGLDTDQDRDTELLVILRETCFPEAQHGEQESPERRYAS